MKNGKIILSALCLFALSLTASSSLRADNNETTIKITPSIVERLVKPGETISGQVRVANDSDKELTLFAYLKDFKAAAEDETGRAQLIIPGTESGNYISSWINISSEGFVLEPGKEAVAPYTIAIPDNVGPGGYYGAIVFGTEAQRPKPGEGETGAAIGVAQQAASLLLLQVEGKADERADVREFKSDRAIYSAPFNVKFTTKINNLGNVHIKPRGLIEIRNMLGKKVTTLTVNEDGGNILPKSARIYANEWKDVFGFGKYEASLSLSYGTDAEYGGEGKKTMTMFWYFWILPAKIIVSTLASLIVALALFIVFLRFYRKQAIKRAMEQMGVKNRPLARNKKAWSWKREYLFTSLVLFGIAVVIAAILYFILF
jgi:hypothetical protein